LIQNLVTRPIDIDLSGTTAVTCFIERDKIYTANAGDSRALLGFQDKNGDWGGKELSRDHKPDLPQEMERI
jgi:serine/threonine protein phosphatase PrpC